MAATIVIVMHGAVPQFILLENTRQYFSNKAMNHKDQLRSIDF